MQDLDNNRKNHHTQINNRIVESHSHNPGEGEKWFFADGINEAGGTPFDLVSGNDALGAELLLLDSGDTPVETGMISFHAARLTITSFDHPDGIYLVKFYYGMGLFGAAVVYTTKTLMGCRCAHPVELSSQLIPVGSKVWAKLKVVGQNAKHLLFVLGVAEYKFALQT